MMSLEEWFWRPAAIANYSAVRFSGARVRREFAPGQEKAFYRAILAGSPVDAVPRRQAFRMMRRCLVAKCYNRNNGDEEKPGQPLNVHLTPNEASRLG
jgi:hypothetical protein